MFASNTVTVHEPKNNEDFTPIPLLIEIHKKVKLIAKYESSKNLKQKIAILSSDSLLKIKKLETELGCHLIAYEDSLINKDFKKSILKQVSNLLDEYLNISLNNKSNTSDDPFSKLFQI